MKVFATVPEHEVEVSIGTDEIAAALHGQPNEKCTLVLNSVAQVLRAISDWQIREQMGPAQRALVREFLTEQAARYVEPTAVTVKPDSANVRETAGHG